MSSCRCSPGCGPKKSGRCGGIMSWPGRGPVAAGHSGRFDHEQLAVFVRRADRAGRDTKTPRSRRTLALPRKCVEALRSIGCGRRRTGPQPGQAPDARLMITGGVRDWQCEVRPVPPLSRASQAGAQDAQRPSTGSGASRSDTDASRAPCPAEGADPHRWRGMLVKASGRRRRTSVRASAGSNAIR